MFTCVHGPSQTCTGHAMARSSFLLLLLVPLVTSCRTPARTSSASASATSNTSRSSLQDDITQVEDPEPTASKLELDHDHAQSHDSQLRSSSSAEADAADGWSGFRAFLRAPVTYRGAGKSDYNWAFLPASGTDPVQPSRTWVQAKPGAPRSGSSYVALGWTFPAQGFLGQRVRLQARVWVSPDISSVSAYAALFVMVANARAGKVMVFDNMRDRRIQAWAQAEYADAGAGIQYEVVVDVIDPYGHDYCPAEDDVPDTIHLGFVACGGRGRVEVSDATFGTVHGGVAVTGGWPPWKGLPDLGEYLFF